MTDQEFLDTSVRSTAALLVQYAEATGTSVFRISTRYRPDSEATDRDVIRDNEASLIAAIGVLYESKSNPSDPHRFGEKHRKARIEADRCLSTLCNLLARRSVRALRIAKYASYFPPLADTDVSFMEASTHDLREHRYALARSAIHAAGVGSREYAGPVRDLSEEVRLLVNLTTEHGLNTDEKTQLWYLYRSMAKVWYSAERNQNSKYAALALDTTFHLTELAEILRDEHENVILMPDGKPPRADMERLPMTGTHGVGVVIVGLTKEIAEFREQVARRIHGPAIEEELDAVREANTDDLPDPPARQEKPESDKDAEAINDGQLSIHDIECAETGPVTEEDRYNRDREAQDEDEHSSDEAQSRVSRKSGDVKRRPVRRESVSKKRDDGDSKHLAGLYRLTKETLNAQLDIADATDEVLDAIVSQTTAIQEQTAAIRALAAAVAASSGIETAPLSGVVKKLSESLVEVVGMV